MCRTPSELSNSTAGDDKNGDVVMTNSEVANELGSTADKRGRIKHYLLEGFAVLSLAALAAITLALHLTRPQIQYTPQAASLEETVQARVVNVIDEETSEDENGLTIVNQRLKLDILTRGPYEGEEITITYNGMGPTVRAVRFREGNRAMVMISEGPEGDRFYQVADHVRLLPLVLIAGTFVILILVIGRWQGLRALIGLTLSGLLIGGFMLPQILAHRDAVWISLTGTGLLLGITLYLIQGWNTTAHVSLMSLLVSLGITGLLSVIWTRLAFLTGFGSEETMFLQAAGIGVEMRGLLLAGIIIGAAGVLDDVVLAQAVTVFELASAAEPTTNERKLSRREIFRSGMKIGVTHLASMVNTLVLAYASTALPLLILFFLFPEPWYLTINRELIAEEIIHTLVGSTGLLIAVPLTTLIAVWVAPRGAISTSNEARPDSGSP
jgi:uncharacterized membrane protein